ncbi:MAG TPA: M23 family metallopeptidase [Anaeromyxobacteraceae bacterium]|jgi:septal ring factor EnvC (AmiA/AmiB activator)|nr:M23 family metallopeptidase [Anaeromyxobacteraceae bacterium]
MIAAALLALSLAAAAPAELEAARARKAAEEEAARRLRGEERTARAALEQADRSLQAAESEAERLEANRAAAERDLSRARAGQAAADRALAAELAVLRPRLAARARMGRMGELRVLASAPSVPELVKRRYLFDRILEGDVALLRSSHAALAAAGASRGRSEAESARLRTLAEEVAVRRAEAARLRGEREQLLARVSQERARHEQAAREAAAQEARLSRFMDALPARASGALHGFRALRGRLPAPVDGTLELGYGKVVEPTFNTVTLHKGVDLRAPRGSPVRAVAAGRVAWAGWFKGYGNLVIVDHGEGYHTLVAHLASMSTATGEEVAQGALLGTVGDTESAKGPFLYFEVRERGRPVDPRGWISHR